MQAPIASPLFLATHAGDIDRVRMLLRCGYPANDMGVGPWEGLSLLHCVALETNGSDILRMLLLMGADPRQRDWHGNLPLERLIGTEVPLPMTKVMLEAMEHLRDVPLHGALLLRKAVDMGSRPHFDLLMAYGASVEMPSAMDPRRGPLWGTLEERAINHYFAERLVEAGADPQRSSTNGDTVLNMADAAIRGSINEAMAQKAFREYTAAEALELYAMLADWPKPTKLGLQTAPRRSRSLSHA